MAMLSMIAYIVKSPDLTEYKERLVGIRRSVAPHLLPPMQVIYIAFVFIEACNFVEFVQSLQNLWLSLEEVECHLISSIYKRLDRHTRTQTHTHARAHTHTILTH